MHSIKSGLFWIGVGWCLAVALFLLYSHLLAAQAVQEGSIKGFRVQEVKFDEIMGGKKPVPKIPRGWRFVGVSAGENTNASNLWFQDGSGNIYVLQGFTGSGRFILDENVQKINAGK